MKYTLSIIPLLLFSLCIVQTTSGQINPVKNGDKYTLSVGDVELVVDASYGARIISYKLGDVELLIPGEGMTGSTLWTSPQSVWNWPPLSTTDSEKYTASIEGNKLIFVSEEEKGMSGKQFKFIKTFWANENNNSISIRYSMVNTGSTSISAALWAVTRVEPEGLTFWEVGDKDPWGSALVDFITDEQAYYWLDFDINNGSGIKFFSDIGVTGWFGHVNSDNILFVKSFNDVPDSEFAPAEGEFEYYVGGSYIELENQSKYATIAAGDTFHYEVTWHLLQLPDDVSAETGNTKLIDFAQQVVDSNNSTNVDDFVASDVSVFPNPVYDVLTVDIHNDMLSNAMFNLYSISGRLTQTENIIGSAHIDVSSLRNGVYFYTIISNKKLRNGKLIKQ